MIKSLTNWLRHNFGDPDIIALFFVLAFVILLFIFFGDILMPVVASIVIAYLLQWGVRRLERYHFPHVLAVILVYALFLALVGIALLGLLPLLWRQLSSMVNELPNTFVQAQAMLMHLPDRYPSYISPEQLQQLITESKLEMAKLGQYILSASLSSIPNVIAVIVYLVMVPLLVYFFLMDRKMLLNWFERYVPKQRRVIHHVWTEVHEQIGNYIGGKLFEMLIVWSVCYLVFLFMGLHYAVLLSAVVGLSVIVPYIGAVVATVPVVVMAFLQWGWSANFAYLIIAYSVIIILDANILIPLLFSEFVSLHPVAIIVATLFFGKLWGFWGVFFAIPLAILVKAILKAFPR